MITIFTTVVMLVTIVAAFLIGIAAARKLVSGVLHLMMLGRLKKSSATALTTAPAESR